MLISCTLTTAPCEQLQISIAPKQVKDKLKDLKVFIFFLDA